MISKFLKNIDFNRDIFVAYLRLVVGGYFLYASLDKIVDPYTFARVIEAYEFSSSIGLSSLDTFLALVLPWLEFILGIFLITGTFIDEVINIIIWVLLFFIIILFQAYLKGLDISCGCTAEESSLGNAIIRDFALLLASLIIKFRSFFYLAPCK